MEVLAVKQPWKLRDIAEEKVETPKASLIKDDRIPNSLNIEMPHDKEFEPEKYRDSYGDVVPLEPRDISEIKSPKEENQMNYPLEKDFPEFQKVLTYSNLQLKKELGDNSEDRIEDLKKEFYGDNLPDHQNRREILPHKRPTEILNNSSEHMRVLDVSPSNKQKEDEISQIIHKESSESKQSSLSK